MPPRPAPMSQDMGRLAYCQDALLQYQCLCLRRWGSLVPGADPWGELGINSSSKEKVCHLSDDDANAALMQSQAWLGHFGGRHLGAVAQTIISTSRVFDRITLAAASNVPLPSKNDLVGSRPESYPREEKCGALPSHHIHSLIIYNHNP